MDKIQEIMGLVQEYAGYERQVVKMEIESALRELVERNPLSDAQIERENLHELFAAGVRFAENCHNIGA